MEQTAIERAVAAILFAAGEPVGASRMAMAAGVSEEEIHTAAQSLMSRWNYERFGIRIVQLDDAYQMCSSGEMADVVTKALETRKPPRLSPAQLEALNIVAYYQPVTKAYIEQLRGVDSSYAVSALLSKQLITEAGRLNVPGRPILYETTPVFLRTFGLTSLEELPPIEKADIHIPEGQQLQLPEVSKEEGTV